MPNEITAQLSVEYVNPNTLGASRELLFNAHLDEGFDRAYWKSLSTEDDKVWVPIMSGKELSAGIFMAATYLSEEPFPFSTQKTNRMVDLNRSPDFSEADALEWAASQLNGHVVCLTLFSGSSLWANVEEGLPTGIDFRIFEEKAKTR